MQFSRLTPEQREFFATNGYLIVPDALDQETIAQVAAAGDHLMDDFADEIQPSAAVVANLDDGGRQPLGATADAQEMASNGPQSTACLWQEHRSGSTRCEVGNAHRGERNLRVDGIGLTLALVPGKI